MSGKLYLVPTPIGNLEDITFRAINILKSVDIIACEDTRVSGKLLKHFDINVPKLSYHEHNKKSVGEKIITDILGGKTIALISDAGTPGISDPGYDLVLLAIKNNVEIISIPGAVAATTALVASGINTSNFYFYGFLEPKKKAMIDELNELKKIHTSIILYVPPHKIIKVLDAIEEVFGNINITLAREITKKFEEYNRGNIRDVKLIVKEKGEMVLIIDNNAIEESKETLDDIILMIKNKMENGDSSKDAIKELSKESKFSKNEIYEYWLTQKKKNNLK